MALPWFTIGLTATGQLTGGVTLAGLAGPLLWVVAGSLTFGVLGLAVQDDEDPIARLTREVRRVTAGEDADFDLGRTDEIGELAEAIDELVASRRATKVDEELTERYRREFYEITADPDIGVEEKIDRLLSLGRERLGVESGLITSIEEESGRYEVERAVGSDFVTAGTVTQLLETFCRKTITTDEDVLAIFNAPEEGYGDDPGYRRWNIGCYLGSKLTVDDQLYGTLCFVNEEPRQRHFSADEKLFVDLMGRWVSHAIERRTHLERLRLANRAMHAAPIGITVTDATEDDNPLVRTNPAFESITGYAEAECVGQNCRFLQGPETDEKPVEAMRRAIDEREPVSVELKNYRKDGTPFWNRVSIAPVTDETGEVTNFVGFQEDVTERTEKERELQRQRDYTEDLLDAIDDVFYVIDESGDYLRWNESFRQLTGYEDEEIGRMQALDFFPESEWGTISDRIEEVFETGSGRVETEVLTRSGERVPYEFIAARVEDPDGNPVLTGIGRDISARKRYEAELERTTDMLQQAGRIAKFGGWELDLTVDPPAMTWTDELYDIHDVPHGETIDVETAVEHYHPGDRGFIRDRIERASETGRGYDMEVRALTNHGDVRWVRALGEAVRDESGDVVSLRGAVQDITERKEREFALESLHESTRKFLNAETPADVTRIIATAADTALDVDGVGIFLYDEEANRLTPTAVSGRFDIEEREVADDERTGTNHGGADGETGAAGLGDVGPGDDSVLWHAFVTESLTVVDDVESDAEGPERAVEHGLVVPMGTHGVLLAATGSVTNDADTRQLVETLVASAAAALDRLDSEADLRERDAELEARNERLRRQIRINETIRSVDRTLIGATSQADVEREVCEKLAAGEDVTFAWIGGFDEVGETLVPRAWAGEVSGYLDSDVFTRGGSDPEPAVAAAEQGEVSIVETVARDVQRTQWRRAALAADVQSVLAVPLELEEYRYGILAVYAAEPRTFGDLERSVFAELGESIANAISTISTRRALHADSVISLSLRLEGATDPLSAVAVATDCEVHFEGLATHTDEATRLFVRTVGADATTISDAFANRHDVIDHRLISESDDGGVFEVSLQGGTLVTRVVRHGGNPRSVSADATGLDAVVEVPLETDVRAFIDMLAEDYSVELVGRREVSRSLQTRHGVVETFLDDLTKRQEEVLRTAYLAGFFNWPRDVTGEQLADMLDVSQPTINRHLRLAEQRIMDQLFSEDAG